MRLTVTSRQLDVRTLVPMNLTVEELTPHLTTHEIGDKGGEALIPAIFAPCPKTCRNFTKGSGIDCGGSGAHRLNANVVAMSGLGVDLDSLSSAEFERLRANLQSQGLLFWWWNTHSYQPATATTPEVFKARILIPFEVELPIKHPEHWSKIAWPALMSHVGLDGLAGADQSCRDPARVYYLPRKPNAASTHGAGFNPGRPLDWRQVLQGDWASLPEVAEIEVDAGVDEDPSRPVDLQALREAIQRPQKEPLASLVKLLAKGEALSPPPDKRPRGAPSRYVAWRTVTVHVANVAEDWMVSTALLELLRPSWTSEVQESPEDHTPWETVQTLLMSARGNAPAYRARVAAEKEAHMAAFRRMLSRSRMPAKAAETAPEEEEPEAHPEAHAVPVASEIAVTEESEDLEAWTARMAMMPTKKDEEPRIRCCADNVSLILREQRDWKGAFRLNQLTHVIEVHRGPLLEEGELPRDLRDSDAANASDWFAREYEFRLSDAVIWSRILAAAEDCAYDPLIDYLEPLQWDGTVRLTGWLQKYLGAPGVDRSGRDVTEYLETVGTRWLVSAVARALKPGCKADVMLELEGVQGTGKSSALAILGGKFFTDAPIDFGNKDSLMVVAQSWIIELAELDALRKSEVTQQRAFLSKTFDDFRPPYGRVTKRYPRRCVFGGTTNADDYLQDELGNRRHLPVLTGTIDREGLARDRDQLWAEAVAYFKAGMQWHLTPEEQTLANGQTAQRMSSDSIAEAIEAWIVAKPPERRPAVLTMAEICKDVLEESPARGLETRIGKALRRLGFWRAGEGRGYVVPEVLMDAPRREGPSIAARVAQAKGLQVLPGGEK